MIATVMIGYYLFAFCLLATVGYLAGRKNLRELRAVAGSATVELRGTLSPSDGQRLAEVPDTAASLAFTVVLRKHPEGGALLHELAATLVRHIDQYERGELGGVGVYLDADRTAETETDLFLALAFKAQGADDLEKIVRIHAMLNGLAAKARTEMATTQDADLRARIAAELESPIPRSVAARLVVPTTPA